METNASDEQFPAYVRKEKVYLICVFLGGGTALFLFLFLWWYTWMSGEQVFQSPSAIFLFILLCVSAVIMFYGLWRLSEGGIEMLEIFLKDLQHEIGGSIELSRTPRKKAPHLRYQTWLFEVVQKYNAHYEYKGRIRAETVEILAILHDPKFGLRWLEVKLRKKFPHFPVLWIWFEPPFDLGFEVERGIFVDSKEGAYTLRPYAGILRRWQKEYGLKNIRYEEGILELRFPRFRSSTRKLLQILHELHELPA